MIKNPETMNIAIEMNVAKETLKREIKIITDILI